MNNKSRNISALGALASIVLVSLGGCAITQTVKPVSQAESREVCVIENPQSEMDFGPTYERLLGERGYQVKRLPPSSAVDQCPVTSTYMGIWRWDVTIYMAYAEIKIYQGGQLAGQAIYDSQKGGANLGKFIKAEPKIRELVTELLPPPGRNTAALSPAPPSTSQATAPQAAVAQQTPNAVPIVAAPVPQTSVPPPPIGQSAFTVERLAKNNQTCAEPVASLTAKGPGFETYTVKCSNGDAMSFRCEFGNCRVLQ